MKVAEVGELRTRAARAKAKGILGKIAGGVGPRSSRQEPDVERGTTFLIVTYNHDLAAQRDRIIELVERRLAGGRRNPAIDGVLQPD